MGRKYFLIALLLSAFSMFGSHLSGGDIQYRYIGDSTGVARQYKVILRIYRDITGIPMLTTDNVTVSSNCYANINVPVTLQAGSGNISPTLFDCVTPSSSTKTLEVYVYIGYTTLPGNCSTYRFWYSNCCRPGGITNINSSNGVGADGFYFDALLDNASQGQNSSPIFVSEPVRAFCVGNPFSWKQSTIEYDGDSVVYSLINCRENAYPNQTDVPFDAGWTAQQPITSTYFNLNSQTGLITFLPTAQEIDVLSVLVEEYRYDSTWGYWYLVGSASRDMMVSISAICNPSAMSGVQYDTTLYSQDTLTAYPAIYTECGALSVNLKFHIALDCYSVNNQDFRMTAPNGQPMPITGIVANCNVNEETDSLEIQFFDGLKEGRYYLYSKKGTDGNTLINKCGLPMNEFDTIVVLVGKCPEPPPPGELPDILYGIEPIPPTPQPNPPSVTIPNVMTPNGDDKNDLFIITNLEGWEYKELIVLNRWGQVVYYNPDYENDWNGTYEGKPLADGVYFGVLNISYKDIIERHDFNLTILDGQ
jgi:gliding motility-associated-like protein